MNGAAPKQNWIVAALGAVAAVALMMLLFRAPRSAAPEPARRGVSVNLGSGSDLRDEATIFDPMPLFLPTKWNAAPKPIESREPGAAFSPYLPKLGFAEMELKLDALSLPPPVKVPRDPATAPGDVLALPVPGALAAGLGRTDVPVQALRGRGAYVEIVAAGDGRPVLSRQIEESVRPPGNGAWQPLEFAAAVDPAGLVGPLVLTTRSGVEEVDSFFQNYLARTLRVGERLAPGFYRISVGP